jgi:hypothetical protein
MQSCHYYYYYHHHHHHHQKRAIFSVPFSVNTTFLTVFKAAHYIEPYALNLSSVITSVIFYLTWSQRHLERKLYVLGSNHINFLWYACVWSSWSIGQGVSKWKKLRRQRLYRSLYCTSKFLFCKEKGTQAPHLQYSVSSLLTVTLFKSMYSEPSLLSGQRCTAGIEWHCASRAVLGCWHTKWKCVVIHC